MLLIIANHLSSIEKWKNFSLLNDEVFCYLHDTELKFFYTISDTGSSIRESIIQPVKFEIFYLHGLGILNINSDTYPKQNSVYFKIGSMITKIQLIDLKQNELLK